MPAGLMVPLQRRLGWWKGVVEDICESWAAWFSAWNSMWQSSLYQQLKRIAKMRYGWVAHVRECMTFPVAMAWPRHAMTMGECIYHICIIHIYMYVHILYSCFACVLHRALQNCLSQFLQSWSYWILEFTIAWLLDLLGPLGVLECVKPCILRFFEFLHGLRRPCGNRLEIPELDVSTHTLDD